MSWFFLEFLKYAYVRMLQNYIPGSKEAKALMHVMSKWHWIQYIQSSVSFLKQKTECQPAYLTLKARDFTCRVLLTKLRRHSGGANRVARSKHKGFVDGDEGVGGGRQPVAGGGGACRGRGRSQHRHLASSRHKSAVCHADAALLITQNLEHVTCTELSCKEGKKR